MDSWSHKQGKTNTRQTFPDQMHMYKA